jgi:hypothetical protein
MPRLTTSPRVGPGAEFKDTIQPGHFKYLRDMVCDIHQPKDDCISMGPLPQAQQDTQTARIDAVNLCQVKYQHPGVCLAKHRIAQHRAGIADYNSPVTP